MKKTSIAEALRNDIQLLRDKQTDEWRLLKAEFLHTYESLKPINILKSTLKEVTASPQIKNSVIGSVAGLTTGLLTGALWPGALGNPIKILVTTMLQAVASNVITENAHGVRLLVAHAIDFFGKKQSSQRRTSHGNRT